MEKFLKKNLVLVKLGFIVGLISTILTFHFVYLFEGDRSSFHYFSFTAFFVALLFFMALTFTSISIVNKINYERLLSGKPQYNKTNQIVLLGLVSFISYYLTDCIYYLLEYYFFDSNIISQLLDDTDSLSPMLKQDKLFYNYPITIQNSLMNIFALLFSMALSRMALGNTRY
jgi:hypothetical protein